MYAYIYIYTYIERDNIYMCIHDGHSNIDTTTTTTNNNNNNNNNNTCFCM